MAAKQVPVDRTESNGIDRPLDNRTYAPGWSSYGYVMEQTDAPVIAQYKPYYQEVEEGKTYLWCACGLSRNQPYCDQSHVGTTFRPVRYRADATRSVLFCGCKHTGNPPFCDGSHNNLTDEYAADERPREQLLAATEQVCADTDGIAWLDGGCYVMKADSLKPEECEGLRIMPVIDEEHGAKNLSQYYVEVPAKGSPALSWPGADTLVFVLSGRGEINIDGEVFAIAEENGAYVADGESLCLGAVDTGPMRVLLTVCPGGVSPVMQGAVERKVGHNVGNRIGVRDPALRNVMADRFYQVLIGEENGSAEIAQFIGEIPKSKAAPHRHLYEEAIVILSGEGVLWTQTRRTPIAAGDIIFLPAQQEHSLECTDSDGMALAGHFYPSGSPNINY